MTEENHCHHLKPLLRIQPGHQPPPPSPLTNGLGGHNTRQSVPALMTSPKGLIVTLPFPFLAPSQDVSYLLEAALPSVSKSLPFPQRLFWEPARITGGTARRAGRHCPLAPQRWEGTVAEARPRRKETPLRLAEATGRASCGLRPAQEPVTLALSGWADLAVWGPVTPWLCVQRRKLFHRLIPHQFS